MTGRRFSVADRYAAEILIGGELSQSKRLYAEGFIDDTTVLQGLIGALHQDGASHEYGEPAIADPCTVECLLAYLDKNDNVLRFQNDQACNGEFEATEEFCQENGISFDRRSDHYCENDAENAYWRPGMNSTKIRYADASGNEIICGETVRKALKKLESFREASPGDPNKGNRVDAALRLLHEACPPLPPNLEPFRIIA